MYRVFFFSLSDCDIGSDGYAALASALKLKHLKLEKLDLSGNDPGKSLMTQFFDFFKGPRSTILR